VNTINILIIRKYSYEERLRETVLVPNTSASQQITLAAEVDPAEEQFLLLYNILTQKLEIIYTI
jgi:hypothetical protein